MEATTKHSRMDPEAKPASTEQSQDRRTPLGADNQNTQSTFQAPPQAHQHGVAEGPDAPQVKYPRALYAAPGYQPSWPLPLCLAPRHHAWYLWSRLSSKLSTQLLPHLTTPSADGKHAADAYGGC